MKYKGKKMTNHRVKQLKKAKQRMDEWKFDNIYRWENIFNRMENGNR